MGENSDDGSLFEKLRNCFGYGTKQQDLTDHLQENCL